MKVGIAGFTTPPRKNYRILKHDSASGSSAGGSGRGDFATLCRTVVLTQDAFDGRGLQSPPKSLVDYRLTFRATPLLPPQCAKLKAGVFASPSGERKQP